MANGNAQQAPLDFSDLGGQKVAPVPVQPSGIDFSDLGGQKVQAPMGATEAPAQPVSLHQLTAALPGAMQSRPGGPITNTRNPQASEQDPGVWQGFKDSVWDTAHGLYSLAKAQW